MKQAIVAVFPVSTDPIWEPYCLRLQNLLVCVTVFIWQGVLLQIIFCACLVLCLGTFAVTHAVLHLYFL